MNSSSSIFFLLQLPEAEDDGVVPGTPKLQVGASEAASAVPSQQVAAALSNVAAADEASEARFDFGNPGASGVSEVAAQEGVTRTSVDFAQFGTSPSKASTSGERVSRPMRVLRLRCRYH